MMTENLSTTENASSVANASRKRPRPLIIVGAVLWVVCFAAIFVSWYVANHRRELDAKGKSVADKTGEDDGRTTKEIRLTPQQDGSFAIREATDEKDDNPWDAGGIEDFSFTDTEGHTVTRNDLLGKPFCIAFIFTMCRGPCPLVTGQMRELQNVLKKYDFNLVTLTVDPARDTTDVLKNYGKSSGANFDRWKFLTGDQAEIYGLIHRSFKMPVQELEGPERKPGFEIIHSRNIMLVNAEGRVVGKFDAQNERDMDRLKKELKKLAGPMQDSAKSPEGPKAHE